LANYQASNFIRLNRRLLTDRIKEMYGKELADEYIDKLTQPLHL
jgi:ribonucleoside-triphosphate reductase